MEISSKITSLKMHYCFEWRWDVGSGVGLACPAWEESLASPGGSCRVPIFGIVGTRTDFISGVSTPTDPSRFVAAYPIASSLTVSTQSTNSETEIKQFREKCHRRSNSVNKSEFYSSCVCHFSNWTRFLEDILVAKIVHGKVLFYVQQFF